MIGEHIYMNTIQVVSPYLECKQHSCKLEVMSWIVLLMHLKLSRGIRYNLIFYINTQPKPTLDASQ